MLRTLFHSALLVPMIAAKSFGARGLGVDLDPRLSELAHANAARGG